MRTVSLRDIKKTEAFSHMEELEIVKPQNDESLLPILYLLGIDTAHSFQYHAANHRDISGKSGIGIYVVGESRTDRAFINSGMCSTFDRIVIAGQKDVSLMLELCTMSGVTLDYKSFFDEHESDEADNEDFPQCLTETDWQDCAKAIKVLEDAILEIRGNPYRKDGSLKFWTEY